MTALKLLALDEEDLRIISAHLQDAVMRVADMAYLPGQQRFAAILNRFDWLGAEANKASRGQYLRRRSALRFDRVQCAQLQNVNPERTDQVLELLAIQFEQNQPPDGYIKLIFAGGAAIRLKVECIEAELRDLGAAWRTKLKPNHAVEDEEAAAVLRGSAR